MRTQLTTLFLLACNGTDASTTQGTEETKELQRQYDLPDEAGYPEGFTFHEASRSFYMGSLEHGSLQRMTADGTLTRVFEPESGWTSLGVKTHPDTGDVLVCAVRDPSTPTAISELWVYTPANDAIVRVALEGLPANCNDLVAKGDHVYLTDREAAQIHRVTLSTLTSEIWRTDPELTPGLIGNNGLELTADGSALILGQFAPARILHVPLEQEGVNVVALSGDDFGFLPNGADGMAWVNGQLIVAAHASIARVVSADDWSSANVFATDTPVDIVAVTEADGELYGLNGEIVPFVLGLPAELPFEILSLPMP